MNDTIKKQDTNPLDASSIGYIGILGGLGPYAGLDLNKAVFDNTIATKDQDHLGTILLSPCSEVGDRSAYLRGLIGLNPAFGIASGLLRLELSGASVASIACNTAHSPRIYGVVREELARAGSKLRLVSIVEATYEYIRASQKAGAKIGLLATLGTYESALYSDAFSAHGTHILLEPSSAYKKICHDAIYDANYGVKAHSNPVSKEARALFCSVIDELKKEGASAIILGCTEIPLAFEGTREYKGLELINPTTILARALIAAIDPSRLRPL